MIYNDLFHANKIPLLDIFTTLSDISRTGVDSNQRMREPRPLPFTAWHSQKSADISLYHRQNER